MVGPTQSRPFERRVGRYDAGPSEPHECHVPAEAIELQEALHARIGVGILLGDRKRAPEQGLASNLDSAVRGRTLAHLALQPGIERGVVVLEEGLLKKPPPSELAVVHENERRSKENVMHESTLKEPARWRRQDLANDIGGGNGESPAGNRPLRVEDKARREYDVPDHERGKAARDICKHVIVRKPGELVH